MARAPRRLGDINAEYAVLFKTHVGPSYQAPLYAWRLDVVGCTLYSVCEAPWIT